MEALHTQNEDRCRLLRPVRDRDGRTHFREQPRILREIENLDRHMFLVRFENGGTTFVFPHEIAFCHGASE
jgi:hypothetical protein